MDMTPGGSTRGGSDTERMCVELLNETGLIQDSGRKATNLSKLQEIIIHQQPALLPRLISEIIAFQSDPSSDVRRCVLSFIEEACKANCEMIAFVVDSLAMLLQDTGSVSVVKRSMQAIEKVYRTALQWLSSARVITDRMVAAWNTLCRLKAEVLTYLDHDNDGVRTLAVKFMESIVLLQTYSEPDGIQKSGTKEFCLDSMPITVRVARPRKLEEEARAVFGQLVRFHGSQHVSSANLMACMSSLTLLARCRPSLAHTVVDSVCALHSNLPPTLAKSQVNSVRKHTKTQLLSLLRQPAIAASACHADIVSLLAEVGATQTEVARAMPPSHVLKQYEHRREMRGGDVGLVRHSSDMTAPTKRAKPTVCDDSDENSDGGDHSLVGAKRAFITPTIPAAGAGVAETESWVIERLTASVATSLVLASIEKLPDRAPPLFASGYRPLADTGTRKQVQLLARQLAEQLARAGLGPSSRGEQLVEGEWAQPASAAKLVSGNQILARKRVARAVKLSDIVRPLAEEQSSLLLKLSLERFLDADRIAIGDGLSLLHVKIVTAMAANFGHHLIDRLLAHILHNITDRGELCMTWLYEEYSAMAGFSNLSLVLRSSSATKYEQVLCMLLSALMCRPDLAEGLALLNRLYMQAPLIPSSAVDILKGFTEDPVTCERGIHLMERLVKRRQPVRLLVTKVLLELVDSHHEIVQTAATKLILQLHSDYERVAPSIEKRAIDQLQYLTLSEPPLALLSWLQQRGGPPPATIAWNDELIAACTRLYIHLLPRSDQLLSQLTTVYVQASPAAKYAILRAVEQPAALLDMHSPSLLSVVEQCPDGAETLITRILHVLTERRMPSAQLVNCVRRLFEQRVADVRLLIPVLGRLQREEVVAALPKLIQLNPVIVKDVFHRLLAVNTPLVDGEEDDGVGESPLTPEDLLVELHNLPDDSCDMKTIIKATGLCFAERHIYTQEVLAVVLQRLMDQPSLPTLLMRTVIQSLALYNRLIGLVMNILQRLIGREVWLHKRVWQGFIKCCQRTVPNSCPVMLQLPADQLQQLLSTAAELRNSLLDYVAALSEAQRAHVADSVMSVVMGEVRVKTELNALTGNGNTNTTNLCVVNVKQEPPDTTPTVIAED